MKPVSVGGFITFLISLVYSERGARKWEDNPSYHSYFPQKGDKHVGYSEGNFVGYRGYDKSKVAPQFRFGFGLSYTTFNYSDLGSSSADIRLKGSYILPRQ